MAQEEAEFVTVRIRSDLYKRIEDRKDARGTSIIALVNETLETAMRTYEMLEKQYPELAFMGEKRGYIMLTDTKNNIIANLKIDKNDRWYCEYDKSNDCKHVHYVIKLPETFVLAEASKKEQK